MQGMLDRGVLFAVNIGVYLRYLWHVRRFRKRLGYFPNVGMPRRYTEKLLWRKLFDHNPQFTTFVDKLAAKKYIRQRCPDLPLPEILWHGTDPDSIPPDLTDSPVFVKSNHGSGDNLFWDPGDPAQTLPAARIRGWMQRTFGIKNREWAYRDARKLILVEECIGDPREQAVDEIEIHACDGRALVIEYIAECKTERQRKGYFALDGTRWTEIEPIRKPGARTKPMDMDRTIPPGFGQAVWFTERLSVGIDYARFDFFSSGDALLGGEITVYPGAGLTEHLGFAKFHEAVSSHWDLRKSWFLTTRQKGWRKRYADALRRSLEKGADL